MYIYIINYTYIIIYGTMYFSRIDIFLMILTIDISFQYIPVPFNWIY